MKLKECGTRSSSSYTRDIFQIASLLVLVLNARSELVKDVVDSGNLKSDDIPANKNTTMPKTMELNLCSDTDNVSSTYCSCEDRVINCDFSLHPGSEVI